MENIVSSVPESYYYTCITVTYVVSQWSSTFHDVTHNNLITSVTKCTLRIYESVCNTQSALRFRIWWHSLLAQDTLLSVSVTFQSSNMMSTRHKHFPWTLKGFSNLIPSYMCSLVRKRAIAEATTATAAARHLSTASVFLYCYSFVKVFLLFLCTEHMS